MELSTLLIRPWDFHSQQLLQEHCLPILQLLQGTMVIRVPFQVNLRFLLNFMYSNLYSVILFHDLILIFNFAPFSHFRLRCGRRGNTCNSPTTTSSLLRHRSRLVLVWGWIWIILELFLLSFTSIKQQSERFFFQNFNNFFFSPLF